jgi:hypothetical protein
MATALLPSRAASSLASPPDPNHGLPAAMALSWEVCGLGQRAIGKAFGVSP